MLSYRNPEIIEHYDFIRVSLRTIVHETMDYRTFMPLRAIYKKRDTNPQKNNTKEKKDRGRNFELKLLYRKKIYIY